MLQWAFVILGISGCTASLITCIVLTPRQGMHGRRVIKKAIFAGIAMMAFLGSLLVLIIGLTDQISDLSILSALPTIFIAVLFVGGSYAVLTIGAVMIANLFYRQRPLK